MVGCRMVDIPDEFSAVLRDAIDGTRFSMDWAEDQYQEQYKKHSEHLSEDQEETMAHKIAASAVQRKVTEELNQPEPEDIPILAIGYNGPRPMGGSRVLFGYGLANPSEAGVVYTDDEEDSDPPGLSVFVCDEDDMDVEKAQNCFQPLNTLKGTFTRARPNKVRSKGGNVTYRMDSTLESDVEEVEIDSLPSTLESKRKGINEMYLDEDDDVFTLETASQHMSIRDGGYTADYGLDIKRIRGYVVDVYRKFGDPDDPEDSSFGVYTIADNTVANVEDLKDAGLDGGNEQGAIGLTVWMEPELVQYDVDSYVDVYGALRYNDDHNIVMDGYGMVPVSGIPINDGQEPIDDDVETTSL